MKALPLLIRGATVWDVEKSERRCEDVFIEEGVIRAVGESLSGELSADHTMRVIDATEMVLTPGLIDVHTHMGLWEEGYPEEEGSGNEMTHPVTPHLRVLDAINPEDPAFFEARRAGFTTVQILPGSANVIGGQGAVLKTSGHVVDQMVRRQPSGLKVAFGENPKNVYKGLKMSPSTRMAVASTLREAFIQAGNYRIKQEKKTRGEQDESAGVHVPERNLKTDIILDVLDRKLPLRVHAHRADDIATALRVAAEFGVKMTLEHGTEGFLVADLLAEKKVPVAFGPVLASRSKLELARQDIRHILPLWKAGVPISLITDHPVIPINFAMAQAAEVVRAGVDPEQVMKFLTLNAAAHLGFEDELGSISEGKRADLVLWSGDPFHYRTRVLATVIDGEVVYRAEGAGI